jgi:anti-sigma regulatory factor (Ser/Thr protein kinase)
MPGRMKDEHALELHIPSRPESLCLVRALVRHAAEAAGCNPALCEQLTLAVNEACMNVIQHAYKGDVTGEIVLETLKNGSDMMFRIRDFASPIDFSCVKPRVLEDVRPGGLGVHFIREIMDYCEMGHLEQGGGNYLELRKKID